MSMAKYYDEIYKDKDYAAEAKYVHDFMHATTASILDLGCGTGRHGQHLKNRYGVTVIGVDSDPEKIAIAKTRIPCSVGDVRNYKTERKYDAVISLFHVASYMTDDEDMTGLALSAYNALRPNGLFIFDFWYGPAVINNPPEKRDIRLTGMHRFCIPTINYNENTVDVEYLWYSNDLKPCVIDVHKMRYWFFPEHRRGLNNIGFDIIKAGKWMGGELGLDSWYGCIVARKK
jgi:SAM-dependent methyltransferase